MEGVKDMNLLEDFLSLYNKSIIDFQRTSLIPESTLRLLNKKELSKWTISQVTDLANYVGVDKSTVIEALEVLEQNNIKVNNTTIKNGVDTFNLENRRYIGSKLKLIKWIKSLILQNTSGNSFFDVFAGTGIVTKELYSHYDKMIINDFLYSNNIIYHGFFDSNDVNYYKVHSILNKLNKIKAIDIDDNYFSLNYGGKFFSENDAKRIGYIRDQLEYNFQ